MDRIAAELLALKDKISQYEQKKHQLVGRQQQLFETLKKEYGVSSIQEGLDLYDEIEKRVQDRQIEINRCVEYITDLLNQIG